jgi:hypothetical protein
MSWEAQDDNCPGCRPALIGPDGKVLPPDSPVMQAIFKMWETTTREERQAFHRVCCQNSRAPQDMGICQGLMKRIQAAMETVKAEPVESGTKVISKNRLDAAKRAN